MLCFTLRSSISLINWETICVSICCFTKFSLDNCIIGYETKFLVLDLLFKCSLTVYQLTDS